MADTKHTGPAQTTGIAEAIALAQAGSTWRQGESDVPEGQRNAALASYVGGLLVKGRPASTVTDEEAAKVLEEARAANSTYKPPLPDAEVQVIVTSITGTEGKYRAGLRVQSTADYLIKEGGIWQRKWKDGSEIAPIRLTNFMARIIEDVVEDDGAEIHHVLVLECWLKGRRYRGRVLREAFTKMDWPTEVMGAEAIVAAGLGRKDHARAAIQELSGDIPHRYTYTHTGWITYEGQRVYLHGGGGIGRFGSVTGIEVRLPAALSGYHFADRAGVDPVLAVEATLRYLGVAPLRVTVPALGSAFRAVLAPSPFTAGLHGPTGGGKTAISAPLQQLWGAGMDADNLPGSWGSTGNALGELASAVKDALLVVDDFLAAGSVNDIYRKHSQADQVLRGAANRQGRGRLRPDGTLRPVKRPNGLIWSTGEELPRGHSLQARMLALELRPGDVDWETLTVVQRDARAGLLEACMAGFIRWVADLDEDPATYCREEAEWLRRTAFADGGDEHHKRTADILAHVAVGWSLFVQYVRWVRRMQCPTAPFPDRCAACGAAEITSACLDCAESRVTVCPVTGAPYCCDDDDCLYDDTDGLLEQGLLVLAGLAGAQAEQQATQDPARRYMDLLGAVIQAGRAHVTAKGGGWPEDPHRWGWRDGGSGEYMQVRAQGVELGFIQDGKLYLHDSVAFMVVQEMAQKMGHGLTLDSTAMRAALRDGGYLADRGKGDRRLQARVMVQGVRDRYLVLRASDVVPVMEEEE
jgi:hypothetical protein